MRASAQFPYGHDKIGTVLGIAKGDKPSKGEAYSVRFDGSARDCAWHEDYLVDAAETNKMSGVPA